ncbi:MAG TPA: nucleotidyltransferase family protein [Lacipirellulaceae bacterium]|jgi:glucose-1-phosphate thymidylyltransferase|nr:nucleotidyltransferase family protein [Lacipirellulaceae bacterium]
MEKAVVLAAGRGTRMRREQLSANLTADQLEVANNGLKAMMPVGRPFIDYVLSGLADAGYQRACLVIGPDHRSLQDHCNQYQSGRIEIEFAIQPTAKGTADALVAAQDFVGDDPFLLVNGDNLYPQSALAGLRQLAGSAVAAFNPETLSRGNITNDRLKYYALLWIDSDGLLKRVIEKPSEEQMAHVGIIPLINMNCWRFTPAIIDACRNIEPSPRGEYELTDAVNYAIEQMGERFAVLAVNEPVLDLSTQADVAEVTRRLADIEVDL